MQNKPSPKGEGGVRGFKKNFLHFCYPHELLIRFFVMKKSHFDPSPRLSRMGEGFHSVATI
jgi:hypothetical protein